MAEPIAVGKGALHLDLGLMLNSRALSVWLRVSESGAQRTSGCHSQKNRGKGPVTGLHNTGDHGVISNDKNLEITHKALSELQNIHMGI